ncbi:hypothetical protein Q763_06090 [Flavobacterium beibuense F44-8]|uniref:Histidine kinase n=1 Tax=Flavobacterium beibuense F44-8 TaxID=1406840 RepID=A0A0A2M2Y7_9FLAO|nr:hypothetical protein Q763_06090 [Flavobacterium beibuense F44-8]
MLEDLRFGIVYLSLLSGICGLVFLHKLPGNKAKSILLLIWLSTATELVGKYFTIWTGLLNYYVFNLYILMSFSIYILLLKSLIKTRTHKNLASLLLVIFLVFYFINYFFIQNEFGQILTNSYTVGVLSIIILSFLYMFELFSSNLVLSYSKSVFFWFVLGILIFHVPFLPFMLSLKWFLIDYNPSIYGLIIFFLNLLMNFCFLVGFIWSEKKYNY